MPIPELIALARQLERANVDAPVVERRNMQCVRELRDFAKEHGAPEVAACLNAAAHLVYASTIRSEVLDGAGVRKTAAQLLELLAGNLEALGPWPSVEEDSRAPAPAPENAGLPTLPQMPKPAPKPEPEPAAEEETPAPPATQADARPAAPAPEAASVRPGDVGLPSSTPAVHDMVLGEVLIELGLATREKLESALSFQEQTGLRIGECLLMQGAVGPDDLLEALKLQERMRTLAAQGRRVSLRDVQAEARAKPPAKRKPEAAAEPADGMAAMKVTENMFFGELLLGAEMIDNDQLESAMHIHHLEGIRVGEALVKIGALTPEQVQQGLELQARLRHIAGLQKKYAPADQAAGKPEASA